MSDSITIASHRCPKCREYKEVDANGMLLPHYGQNSMCPGGGKRGVPTKIGDGSSQDAIGMAARQAQLELVADET